MFCNKCGSQVADNLQFCPNCGAAVNAAQRPHAVPNAGGYNVPYGGNSARTGFNPDKKIFTIVTIVFAAIMALATLLPCVSVTFFGATQSAAFIEADDGQGIFVLLAGLIAAGLAIAKLEKFSFVPAAVSAIILLVFTSDMPSGYSEFLSIGFYLMWIGTIGTIATSVVSLIKKK